MLKSNKTMAKLGSREGNSAPDIHVFNQRGGITRKRSAEDSNEAEHEPQGGSFHERANSNDLAAAPGGYEDAGPICHCSWSVPRKWAASM